MKEFFVKFNWMDERILVQEEPASMKGTLLKLKLD